MLDTQRFALRYSAKGTKQQTNFLKVKVFRSIQDFEWLFRTLRAENPLFFFFHLKKSKFFVDFEKNEFKGEKVKYIMLMFEHLMLYHDLLEGCALKTFLTETDNEKFKRFKKKYPIERKLFNKLGLNYNMKYFKKYEDLGKMPKLLDLAPKDKQKVKTYIPKYYSKYLEKTESILKRLKKEMDLFEINMQKTVHSCFSLSEIFVELFNQKKLLILIFSKFRSK